MSELDRARAAALMGAAGLDALVLFQPEAFRYATGVDPGVAAMWRRAGGAVAVVPSDPAQPVIALLSDHAARFGPAPGPGVEVLTHRIWIDFVDWRPGANDPMAGLTAAYRTQGLGGARPESFDAAKVFGLLGEALASGGLGRAAVGADFEFLPAADLALLQKTLPAVAWQDGSEVLRRLRCIKSPLEIEHLIDASNLSEAGLHHMAERLRPGLKRSELDALWREGVAAAAAKAGIHVSGDRAGISVGPDLVAPDPTTRPGDLVKADMGVAVAGYLSDGTRTYALGAPPEAALQVFAVLEEAFQAGLEQIGPGRPLGGVHAAVLATTRRLGLEDYYRGHFGHSIGASCGSEEWPFISDGNAEPMQAGMMLAFETPAYIHGLGAMMIEDQVLVTETGAQAINRLPRGLQTL